MDKRRGSIIPPGQADLAMFLSTLPQVSELDCGVELDQLTMSGLNEVAHRTGKTVGECAKEAVYLYLRMAFMRSGEMSYKPYPTVDELIDEDL